MSEGTRRLAAIMFTDMVGYTALGQRNESLSLALVEEQRNLLRPVITKHQGREVKTIGDAFLVEFTSAVEAVRCAYDSQRVVKEFNMALPNERRIHIRVGIHLGEVVEKEGDILGDAVNVASRIEPLADDGGVCLTQQVYDHVHNKLEFRLASLGRVSLKNVSEPMEVYKLVMPWEQERTSPLPKSDRGRIAILPFANISPDSADDYFADGMTEELISTTSSIKGLTVIARTSVMRYKGQTKGIEEVGKELGVGTVLEGSVRKAGNRLRITVQLIDVQDQGHLWSQSYDREFDDVFAVQSDIAKQVADALRIRILPNETMQMEKRPTRSTEAFTQYLRGRHLWNQRRREAVSKAVGYFERAIELDPSYGIAYVGLADCYAILGDQGALPSGEAFSKARGLATKALELDDSMAEAHATLGTILEHEWDWAGAERELKRAIELNPGYPTAHHWYAVLLMTMGRHSEAMAEIRRAHELDPLSPVIRNNIGWSYIKERRYDEALAVFREVLETDPEFRSAHNGIQSVYVAKSMFQVAITEAQRARGKWPEAYWFLADSLVYCLAMAGRRHEALKIVDELVERSKAEYVSPFRIASAYIGIDKGKVFKWLEKGYEVHDGLMMYLKGDLLFETLYSDPRYVAMLRRMGLEK
jgi:adenylate cyclase